jgi:pyruvate dehydrogenase E2 component (dihydrolipoamide acetyltransferase)
MSESKATAPDFVVAMEIDMEGVVEMRDQLRGWDDGGAALPSFNDFVVKACALALREHELVNGSYDGGEIRLHGRVNVGIAVAAPGALIVPTIFDADRKSLGEIARTTRALAAKVRDGSITPPELSGGTFSISNLGMFGVDAFTAVLNPPQAAILAVGSVTPRAVVRDGALTARRTMSTALTCDHRIVYGADAAAFLARVRTLLETPISLVL